MPDAVALADRDRDHVVADAAARQRRQLDAAGARLDREHVAALDAQRLRGLVADLRPRLPGDLGDRVRCLLEPGQVRAAAVVEQRRGHRQHQVGRPRPRTAARLELDPRGARRHRERAAAGRPVEDAAPLQRRPEVAARPGGLENGTEAPARKLRGDRVAHRAGHLEQRVAERLRVEERPHARLHERADPRPRRSVAPRLERRVVGQDQVGALAGLVGQRGERHHEADLGERLARSRRPGAASRRDSRRRAAAPRLRPRHRLHQLEHLAEARGLGRAPPIPPAAGPCCRSRPPPRRGSARPPWWRWRGGCVSATPGGSAAGRFASAMARPIRWIVSAGTPVREATDSASKPREDALQQRRIAAHRAAAGAHGVERHARDRRAPGCPRCRAWRAATRPRCPRSSRAAAPRRSGARAWPSADVTSRAASIWRACSTGESQLSSESAPKSITKSAPSRSKIGRTPLPKTARDASRSAS